MREAPSEGEQKGSIFFILLFELYPFLSSFICFHLMVAIISANETFDLA